MALTLKQGDTRHAIRATLRNINGREIDLSNATVRFKMARRYSVTVIDRLANVEAGGTVNFVFNEGETDVPGNYVAEFFVTYADGRVETFPHRGKLDITIEKRIGGL